MAPHVDRFSELPFNVLETILARLTVKEAARTSILSSKWRYTWRRIPSLIFDTTFSTEFQEGQLVSIYQVVANHHARIQSFVLSIPGLMSCPQIVDILELVLRNDVQRLVVEISDGERLALPPEVFSLVNLVQLRLVRCELTFPAHFRGLSKLVCFECSDCIFTGETVQSFISRCPGLVCLKVSSSVNAGSLDLDAPHLVHLVLHSSFDNISLRNVPKLACAALRVTEAERTSNVHDFVRDIPSLLHLDSNYFPELAWNGNGADIPIRSGIKSLTFRDMCCKNMNELALAILLFIHSEQLETFRIVASSYTDDDGDEYGIRFMNELVAKEAAVEDSPFVLNTLKKLVLEAMWCRRAELVFIQHILQRSPNLETVQIQAPEEASEEERSEIYDKIEELSCASSSVEFKYVEPKEKPSA